MTRPSPQTERVIALIDLLVSRPGQTFTLAEVSRRLGVHKQTCHSMLRTLTDAGWLVRHPSEKTYRLGPALAAIGRAASAESPVLEFAHRTMHALAQEFDANCLLMRASADRIAVLDAATPRGRSLSPLAIGQEFPMKAPLGGMFVAWDDEEAFLRWTSSLEDGQDIEVFRNTVSVIRSRGFDVRLDTPVQGLLADLQRNLAQAGTEGGKAVDSVLEQFVNRMIGHADELTKIERRTTYAVSNISAPVFEQAGGPPPYALSLSFRGAPAMVGAEVERIGGRLRAAADDLSQSLGARSPRE